MYYVYVILCRRGRKLSFYTGYTKNLVKRITQHIEGKGARYLRGNKVKKLYYVEEYRSRRKAMQREREIKKFTHLEKKKLITIPSFVQSGLPELLEEINKALGLV